MKKRGRPAKVQMTTESTTEVKEPTETMQARPDPSNRAKRPRRNAVGGAAGGGILTTAGKKDPNFNYRIVNDEGSRIEELKSYGYEIVTDDSVGFNSGNEIGTGSAHSVVVDKTSGKKAILMRQPMEFHEEDRELRAKAIDASEESMFRKLKSEDGRYGDVEKTNSLAKSVED